MDHSKREVDADQNIVYTVHRGEYVRKVFHGDVDIPSEDNTFGEKDIVQFKHAPSWGLFHIIDVDIPIMAVTVSPITPGVDLSIPDDVPPYVKQILGRAAAADGFDSVPQSLLELSEIYVPPPEDDEIELDIPYGGVDKYILWENEMYELKKITIVYKENDGKEKKMVWGDHSEAFGILLSVQCIFHVFKRNSDEDSDTVLTIEHNQSEDTNEYHVTKTTTTSSDVNVQTYVVNHWPDVIIYDKYEAKEEDGDFDELPSDIDFDSDEDK